jgi:hypothetical protein
LGRFLQIGCKGSGFFPNRQIFQKFFVTLRMNSYLCNGKNEVI